jgi:DNA mismatch repair protein MutS2
MISKYQKLHDNLKAKEAEIISKAREEASTLLKDSNKLIEKTIREIRENQAEKEKTKAARSELSEFTASVLSSQQSAASSNVIASEAKQQQPVPTAPAAPSQPRPPHRYQTYLDDLNQKLAHYQLTLDLRGKRADEALSMLQRYMDDAVLLNMTEVRILHGKGNGILRQITRDYLKSVSEVRRYQDAPLENGGAGITVVTFK